MSEPAAHYHVDLPEIAAAMAAELRRLPARANKHGERPGADALKAYERWLAQHKGERHDE
jgi:hypothetical protein